MSGPARPCRAEIEPPAAGRDSGPAKVVAGLLVDDRKTDGRLLGDPHARAFLARLRVQPVELGPSSAGTSTSPPTTAGRARMLPPARELQSGFPARASSACSVAS